MTKITTLILSFFLTAVTLVGGTAASAQDMPDYFLIEETTLHPAKAKTYAEAWEKLLKHAADHDYPFPTYYSKSGPLVNLATPMSSYADMDKLIAERNRIYNDAGSAFARIIDTMDSATHSNRSFMVKHQPEISNPPSNADLENLGMYEIASIKIEPGKSEAFSSILEGYKNRLDAAGLLDEVKYNVYIGGIGTEGEFFFQSFAKDGIDRATQQAKTGKLFETDEKLAKLFEDFQAIEVAGGYSSSQKWNMVSDLGYSPEE